MCTGAGGTAGIGGTAGRGGAIMSLASLTVNASLINGTVGAAGRGANGGLPGGQHGTCCQTFGSLTPGGDGGPGAAGGAIAQNFSSATVVNSQITGAAGNGGEVGTAPTVATSATAAPGGTVATLPTAAHSISGFRAARPSN